MNSSYPLALFLVNCFLGLCTPVQAQNLDPQTIAEALSHSYRQAAESISTSLVSISTSTKTPSPANDAPETPVEPEKQRLNPGGTGTGVIIDDRGYVLTNHHVIQKAEKIQVRLYNSQTVSATIVGKNVEADLALLKIPGDHEPAVIGDSDKVFVGELVIAAGTPFGLENSFTSGIVSAKGRVLIAGMPESDFIQTDAAVNMGNSGGPLLNVRGEVIGINTSIFSRSGGSIGIGFAIPINRAMKVIAPLLKK